MEQAQMRIAPPPEPTARTLQRNQITLERRLSTEIRNYEARYELQSAELEAAVEAGRIRETAEVANWILAYRALRALADEQPARSE